MSDRGCIRTAIFVKSPHKILIFRQSSLGDVILTLPVIRKMKEAFPDVEIDFLTKRLYSEVVDSDPAISRIITFADSASFSAVLKKLRTNKYDLIIDLQSNLRSMLLLTFLFPTKMISYRKRRFAREMVVRRSHLKLSVDHTIHSYLTTLKKLGIDDKPIPPVIALPEGARSFATDYLAEHGFNKLKRIIAFCPGAKHFEKRWPFEQYKETALQLLKNPDIGIIVFSMTGDEFADNLEIDEPRLCAARDFSIHNSAALLAQCDLALTNDSGLMHLANAVRTPVVAIFGPTNPRLGFAPALPGSVVVCDDVSCSPCSVHGQNRVLSAA